MAKMWQEFCARLCLAEGEKRRLVHLLGLLALGLGLMLAGQVAAGGGRVSGALSGAEMAAVVQEQGESENAEDKLAEILGQIAGAGRVRVELTYADRGRTEYAVNVNNTRRQTEEQADGELRATREEVQSEEPVLVDGNRNALVLRETEPKVLGVLVVADGAGDGNVRRVITEAVVGLLGVPAHRVVVCQGQG